VVIVDTTVWIDYLGGVTNKETEWLHEALHRERLALTDLNLCEVLQGVRDERVAKDVERRLLTLEVFDTGGIEVARDAARNYRALRRRGYTVRRTIDCLIASFCIREQHSLLHRDRDFDSFEEQLGLDVIHP